MNKSKVKYPSAVKTRVKGDWNCENCDNLNFSFRNLCNLCGHQRDVPVLFPCAIYANLSCITHTSSSENAPRLVLSLSQLPSVATFFKPAFMQKPTEVYPLTNRALNLCELSTYEEYIHKTLNGNMYKNY